MKGQKWYEAFKAGKPLTPMQAIKVQCYVCNGAEEGGEDCLGVSCPLYQYMPYRRGKAKKELSAEQRVVIRERLKKGRESREALSLSS